MSTLSEVETALGALAFGYLSIKRGPSLEMFRDAYCSEAGRKMIEEKVILLHCTTEYPAPFKEVNLRAMDTMRMAFGLPVGLSDHTPGIAVPIAAVALGAAVIEKHFTRDRNLPGPDHKASLEPDELKSMVTAIRQIETALGNGRKVPSPSELKNREIARKSLMAAKSIDKGDVFSQENLALKRPGTGISPMYYWDLLGKKTDRDYADEELITK
jgi:N-acetylneuraminate synthase